jgi:hypothetical protein
VEALNGCGAKSNTNEQRQSYRVLTFHELPPFANKF